MRDFMRQMWEELSQDESWVKADPALGGDLELLEEGTKNRIILKGEFHGTGAFSIEYQIFGSPRPTRPRGKVLDLYHSYMAKARGLN